MEFQELKDLPQTIESLEQEQNELHAQMADPAFFKQEADRIAAAKNRLEELEHTLETAYQRWQALEEQFEEIDVKQLD
mgnify:CR=1 FL=1